MQKLLLTSIFMCSIIVYAVFKPAAVLAQFTTEPSITITSSNQNPEPGQEVTIKLTSYETNLDLARISWNSSSGNTSGFGLTAYKIISGKTGNIETVSARITMQDGTIVEKTITLTPKTVDVIWEAKNVYIPPFYPGKISPVREDTLRLGVITENIKNTKPVSYSWKRNGSAVQNSRSFIDIQNNEFNKKETITVALNDGETSTERTVFIPFTNAKMLFYAFHPLYGLDVYNTIKDSIIRHNKTASVFAVPLGLDNSDANKKTTFNWELSGQSVNTQANPLLLSFLEPDSTGIVTISLNIEKRQKIYQELKGFLNLVF